MGQVTGRGWLRSVMLFGVTTPQDLDERFRTATTARTPVRRWAEPSEYEQVAAYLADPSLTFHTGDEVVVDGGYCVF